MKSSMLRHRYALTVVAMLTVLLECCARPPTMEECGSDLDCLQRNVRGDTVRNTAIGGIAGAAIGAGVGYFAGGGRGALTGAIAGGGVGAVTAGSVTYYVENANASAIADISATNYKLQYLLSSIRAEERSDNQTISRLTKTASAYRSQIYDLHSKEDVYTSTISELKTKIEGFKSAVIDKYGSINIALQAEIDKYNEIVHAMGDIVVFYKDRIDFLEKEINIMESHQM